VTGQLYIAAILLGWCSARYPLDRKQGGLRDDLDDMVKIKSRASAGNRTPISRSSGLCLVSKSIKFSLFVVN